VRHGDESDPVYGITTAQQSHTEDITRRQKQYIVTMLFRVASIVVVVWVPGLSVLERVILGLVATIIPFFAVIRANGGPMAESDPTNLLLGAPEQQAIGKVQTGLPGSGPIFQDRGTATGQDHAGVPDGERPTEPAASTST
jgi:hypothetical protein